jgi:hypothetical protein
MFATNGGLGDLGTWGLGDLGTWGISITMETQISFDND